MKQIRIILVIFLFLSCTGKHKQNKEKQAVVKSDASGLILNYSKPKGRTISFPEIIPAVSLLHTDTAINIFENKIGKKILFYPDEFKRFTLVDCPNNGLIQTLQECYDNHRPLLLSPDIIWLAICQGVSIHINEKIDSLNKILFFKKKPSSLKFRNDSLENKPEAWQWLINSLATETRKYTKDDLYTFFVPQYTTTRDVNVTAYQITMLEGYEQIFKYIGETGCGIPSITLTGQRDDWQLIYSKLDMLDKFGLSNWKKNLKPVIMEFINVFDGKVNKEFWQSIYKNVTEYNNFCISGWIIKFFPYTKSIGKSLGYDSTSFSTKYNEVFIKNKFLEGDRYLLSTLSTDEFPSGMARVEITWNNYLKKYTKNMEVYAGFFGIKQYPDKTLEPFISWALCQKDTIKADHIPVSNDYKVTKHSDDIWCPHIAKNITDSAIYNIKIFSNQKSSIDFLKSEIKNTILKSKFRKYNYRKDSLEFLVLSNGTVDYVNVIGEKNKAFSEFIKTTLLNMPEKWFPALANPTAVMWLIDYPKDKEDIKIRVNSKVKFALK